MNDPPSVNKRTILFPWIYDPKKQEPVVGGAADTTGANISALFQLLKKYQERNALREGKILPVLGLLAGVLQIRPTKDRLTREK